MLTSILTTDNTRTSTFTKCFSQLLSNLDYSKLSRIMRDHDSNQIQKIVLLEYVHSGCYDVIAQFQRIPGTTITIDDFLKRQDTMDALNSLFANKPNLVIYTRRKIKFMENGDTELTKYKQLVLKITPEVPSPILNPEDVEDQQLEDFDLNNARIMR